MSGGNAETEEISLTTNELLAAIMLFSEKTIFPEQELMAQVAKIRLKTPGQNPPSNTRVASCLSVMLAADVLQYEKTSDVFRFDPRNAVYLRLILKNACVFPKLEGQLRQLVLDATRSSETLVTRSSPSRLAESPQ